MKLSQSINSYLNKKTTLWSLVEVISTLESYENINLFNTIKYIEDNESDQGLIATILLWSIKNSPIKNLKETNNSFIKFLQTVETSDEFFEMDIKWIYTDELTCTYQKGDLLFVINDDVVTRKMQLPDAYCDKDLICLNCNEEIHSSYFVDVPANTFYIIQIVE